MADIRTSRRHQLPAPLVPAGVDLRGAPIPRETFAQLAVSEFGVSIEDARAFVNEVANKIERDRSVARA